MRKELTHAPLMIGQATCQSRCQGLFPWSPLARDGANRSGRDSQQATSRASSISPEWQACRHRRVKLASRSRNVPLIRSRKEGWKTVPRFRRGEKLEGSFLQTDAAIRRTTSTTCLHSVRLLPVPMSKPGHARS